MARWTIGSSRRGITARGLRDSSAHLVPSGSLVLSTRAPVGYVAISEREVAINQGCRALVPSAQLDIRFFAYQLGAARQYLESLSQGTTFAELSAASLAAAVVFAPSAAVQRNIADFLDGQTAQIDSLIRKKERLTVLLEERMLAIRYSGVCGAMTSPRDLAPSALVWLPYHPKQWRSPKLTQVAQLGTGHTPSRDHPEWWTDCTIPWITTGEVSQMRSDRIEYIHTTRELISTAGMANSSAVIHPAGTVVLCRTAASAGYSAIMATDMATSQDFAAWTCGPLLRARFLLLCLRVMRPDLLGRLAMGSTHKTIYMPDIESIRIPLPPVDEQDQIIDAITNRLERLYTVTDSLNHQIALLRERRQALITAAVTGQLDIPAAA